MLLRSSLFTLALLAALPAAAQDRGGLQTRNNSLALLDRIDANRGCPESATSVTVGLNRTTATGASAQQQLGSFGGGGANGCRPLISTQVVAGANLALGRGSSAGQSINALGPAGVLGTTTYTRGYNVGYGAGSSANQRLINQIR